jgi:hypothetical protein
VSSTTSRSSSEMLLPSSQVPQRSCTKAILGADMIKKLMAQHCKADHCADASQHQSSPSRTPPPRRRPSNGPCFSRSRAPTPFRRQPTDLRSHGQVNWTPAGEDV